MHCSVSRGFQSFDRLCQFVFVSREFLCASERMVELFVLCFIS
jgi:hypothetical protein